MTALHIGDHVTARQTWDKHSGATLLPKGRLKGEVIYIDTRGRWVTVQGPHYRESFWMEGAKK